MIPLRRFAVRTFALGGLGALASACVPSVNRPSGAPTPARPQDELVTEIRARHSEMLDAIRSNNIDAVMLHVAPNAKLVLPAGDTIMGRDAIGAALARLHRTFTIQSLRATAAQSAERCWDGVLERTGDWTMAVQLPDQSADFKRDAFAIKWTAVGDSIKASLISLAAKGGMTLDQGNCVSVNAMKYAGVRVSAFMTLGSFMPQSYTQSARDAYAAEGFANPNMGMPDLIPEGRRPDPPAIVGISGRLTDKVWLTVAFPRRAENVIIGQRNLGTFDYVNINRKHFPIGVMADYKWKQLSFGLGPAIAHDQFFYQERDMASEGGGTFAMQIQREEYSKNLIGAAGSVAANVRINGRAALLLRQQMYLFPTTRFPALKTGEDVQIRDFWNIFGFGLKMAY
jgi:hypothetical protein